MGERVFFLGALEEGVMTAERASLAWALVLIAALLWSCEGDGSGADSSGSQSPPVHGISDASSAAVDTYGDLTPETTGNGGTGLPPRGQGGGTQASCGLLDTEMLAHIGVKISVCTGQPAILPGFDILRMLPQGPIVQERAEGLCCFVQAQSCPEVLACMRLDASSPCEHSGDEGFAGLDLTCTTEATYEACVPLPNGQDLKGFGDCGLGQNFSAHLPYTPGFDRQVAQHFTAFTALSTECHDGAGCMGMFSLLQSECEETLRCEAFGLHCPPPSEGDDIPSDPGDEDPTSLPHCTTGQSADYHVPAAPPSTEDGEGWPALVYGHCEGQRAFRTFDSYQVSGAGFGTDCGWLGPSARCFSSIEEMQQAVMSELSPEQIEPLMASVNSPYGEKNGQWRMVNFGPDMGLQLGAPASCMLWPPECLAHNLSCDGDTIRMCVSGRYVGWECGKFLGATCEIVEDAPGLGTYGRCTSQAWPP